MSHANQKGFTLIELMLSMTFIAVLLVAIALTTIQISTIYTKGITLREVNQVGRTVSEELQRNIASSAPFALESRYIERDGGGRLCLGKYSYAWNYGKAIRGGAGAPIVVNKYTDNSAVNFVKVSDPGASLCSDEDMELKIQKDKAGDLLSSGDRDLVIHDFTIAETKRDDQIGQALYAISMRIGTNDREQLTTNDTSCRPPSEGVGNEAYCAVNQLDIIARAGNESEGGQ